MRGRQKIKKNILSLLLVTFILSIDFAHAKNAKWKPGNENFRFPIDRTLQNSTRTPTGRTIQNDKITKIDGNMRNDRRIPIGRTMQNDRRIPIDRTLQNDRRFPTGKTIQNDRKNPIDRTLQNDRIMQYNRDHSAKTYETDGIMQEDRRIRINTILENDRLSENELQKKIDSLMQNKNMLKDKTVQGGRRMLNVRTQNDRKTQNDNLKVQNTTRILDERNLKMINARGTRYDKRMWVATPHPVARPRQDDWAGNPHRILRERKNYYYGGTNHDGAGESSNSEDNSNGDNNNKGNHTEDNNNKGNYTGDNNQGDNVNGDNNNKGNHTGDNNKEDSSSGDYGDGSNDNGGNADQTFNSGELFNVNDFAPVGGKTEGWGNFWGNMFVAMQAIHGGRPGDNNLLTTRTCHIIASTYITALADYKRYYTLRYFYENNLEYEVGYLVSEIISKYQRMLELFDLATQYFHKNQDKQYAPSAYILYVYTNVLEMGTVISHLCNMLNEMEQKYVHIPHAQSGFMDYHLEKKSKVYDDEFNKMTSHVEEYQKWLARVKIQRLKERKKIRAKDLSLDTVVTTPRRKPRRGSFPYIYGWSIEHW